MGKPRLFLGKSLIKLSTFFYKLSRLLSVSILRPDDLILLTRYSYSLSSHLKDPYNQAYVDSGLDDTEEYFVKHNLKEDSKILVFGCGGGRECIALSRMGFRVTGIDFVEECIKASRENARKRNLKIAFICQDMTRLQLPPEERFESIMFSALLYSQIPSKNKRLGVLRKIKPYLKTDGKILLSFFSSKDAISGHRGLKRSIALMTFGNMDYQEGDIVDGDGEFKHFFSEAEIKNEISESGFRLEELNLDRPADSFAILSNI
jgi:2-polyprenyl-3-methyl-5-hydroxy-6-metoxy-1,4-benzoquinol methylase